MITYNTTLLNMHTLNDGSLVAALAPYLNHISGPPVMDSKKIELNSLHRSTETSNTFMSYYIHGGNMGWLFIRVNGSWAIVKQSGILHAWPIIIFVAVAGRKRTLFCLALLPTYFDPIS